MFSLSYISRRLPLVLVLSCTAILPAGSAAQSPPLPVIAANTPLPLPLPAIGTTLIAQQLTTQGGSLLPAGHTGVALPALQPKTVYQVAPGPWGDLEYYVTYLQVPESFLPYLTLPSERTAWHFPETSTIEIEKLLNGIDFPQVAGRLWQHSTTTAPETDGDGIVVFPSAQLIEAIPPETREKLAALLRRSPENRAYTHPVVIESGDAVSWFRSAGLSEDLVQRIARLSYHRGTSLVFSDSGHISSMLPTIDERNHFMRVMTRTRSLVLRLNIGQTDDYTSVIDYWTSGREQKIFLPILESVCEAPEVEQIDIAHLLPPTPRKLLYTFPDVADLVSDGSPDCHWTSLNFFRTRPTPVYLDMKLRTEELKELFNPVSGPLQYGDVIALCDASTGEALHSAVYIAADIVFTKNGRSALTPWILMRYGDMLTRYRNLPEHTTLAFRPK